MDVVAGCIQMTEGEPADCFFRQTQCAEHDLDAARPLVPRQRSVRRHGQCDMQIGFRKRVRHRHLFQQIDRVPKTEPENRAANDFETLPLR